MGSEYCEGCEDQLVQIGMLIGSSKNFVSNRDKLIFNTFINFKQVDRFQTRSDIRGANCI